MNALLALKLRLNTNLRTATIKIIVYEALWLELMRLWLAFICQVQH